MVRVYKYGCRAPSDERLALQALGQAYNHREDLRKGANAALRGAISAARDESAHIDAWLEHHRAAHVVARRWHMWGAEWRADRLARDREARASRGHLCDWGTYSLVGREILAASKAARGPIKGRAFDGTGRIGAFISHRESFGVCDWMDEDHDAHVGAWLEHHRAAHVRERSARRARPCSRAHLSVPDGRGFAVLTIVVGALRDQKEIAWPIKIHRPMPESGTVKAVAVQRIRVGHRYRWEALITVEMADVSRADVGARGVVGVDLGWRWVGDGKQRVAVYSSDEELGELSVDALGSFEYSDAVRGFRDRDFDAAKGYAADSGVAPHARRLKAKAHLHEVARRSGDLGLAMWRERDRHLEDISEGVRARAIRRRRDAYRVFADRLARTYRYIALEALNASDFVGKADTHSMERRRSVAALSELQGAIQHRFGPGRVCWVDPAYTSRTCHSCGAVAPPLGAVQRWICASCFASHDRDENAAVNIRRACEQLLDAKKPLGARPSERKENAKRKTGKRPRPDADSGTARNTAPKAAE